MTWLVQAAKGWVEAARTAAPCFAAPSMFMLRVSFRAEKLRHDLVGPAVFLAVLEDGAVGVRQEIAGPRVDQEELFLDPDCYC